MTNATPLSLSSLDDLPKFPPAPPIFDANLAALSASQPDVAELLRPSGDDSACRLRAGLDGAGFVAEIDGRPLATGTAAPQTRAIGLFDSHRVTHGNYLWPLLGHTIELEVLLRYLPPTAAVFVPVDDEQRLRAELHATDLSHAIGSGRLYFLPDDLESSLLALLAKKPGLQPPATVLRLPWAPAEATERAIAVATRCHGAITQERTRQIETALVQVADVVADPHAIAVVCRSPDAVSQAVAVGLARCAVDDGYQARVVGAKRPDEQHPLEMVRAVLAHRPGLIVFVDEWNAPIARARGAAVVFASTAAGPPGTPDRPASGSSVFVAPAGHAAAEVQLPVEGHAGVELRLLGTTAPATSLAGIGIDQPTDAQIWEAATNRQILSLDERWPTAQQHLERAAKAAGLTLQPSARERLEPIFRRWMLPMLLQRHIEGVAEQAGRTIRDASKLAPKDWRPPPDDRGLVVVIGPLSWRGHELMTAAALGWQIVICEPARDELAAAAIPAELPVELSRSGRGLWKWMNANASERRARIERTMSWVRDQHLLLHRWRTLAARPEAPAAEGST